MKKLWRLYYTSITTEDGKLDEEQHIQISQALLGERRRR